MEKPNPNMKISHATRSWLVSLAVLVLIISWACVGTSSTLTPDTSNINTYIADTAAAANLKTFSALTPTAAATKTLVSTSTPVPTATETSESFAILVTGGSCIPNNPPQTGRVVEVVDGDTIKVILDQDGLTYSVRYIGMDTPENTSQVDYFGQEASAKNSELVFGKAATLIKDVSETDQFGRLLRYVLVDNLFVNYELVAQGYANTASYPPDVACIATFQAAEQQASASKLGLWAASPPTLAVIPATVPLGGGNAPCSCGGPDLDCGDFGSHSSAQACYEHCTAAGYGDVFRLDRDNDGSACETLP
jgi:micrococcal nuclease